MKENKLKKDDIDINYLVEMFDEYTHNNTLSIAS